VRQDKSVYHARIGLTGEDQALIRLHAEFAADEDIELLDLVRIAGKEFDEGSLRSGGALDAAQSEFGARALDALQTERQVVRPVGGAFADGRWLRRLIVREGEARKIAPGARKVGQCVNHARRFDGDEFKRVAQKKD